MRKRCGLPQHSILGVQMSRGNSEGWMPPLPDPIPHARVREAPGGRVLCAHLKSRFRNVCLRGSKDIFPGPVFSSGAWIQGVVIWGCKGNGWRKFGCTSLSILVLSGSLYSLGKSYSGMGNEGSGIWISKKIEKKKTHLDLHSVFVGCVCV